MSRNEKIKRLEAQVHQLHEGMAYQEQIARDAMDEVVRQANEIIGAITHDLDMALSLFQLPPVVRQVLDEMTRQDAVVVFEDVWNTTRSRLNGTIHRTNRQLDDLRPIDSDRRLLLIQMAAHVLRYLSMLNEREEKTPFDVDHAPEIAHFLSKIAELEEKNRVARREPGDSSAGGRGTDEKGGVAPEGEGVAVPLPGA